VFSGFTKSPKIVFERVCQECFLSSKKNCLNFVFELKTKVEILKFLDNVGLLGKKSRAIFRLKMRVAKKSAKNLKFC